MRNWQIEQMAQDAELEEQNARHQQYEAMYAHEDKNFREACGYMKAAIGFLDQACFKLMDAQSILDGTVHEPRVTDLYEAVLSIETGLEKIMEGR